MSWNWLNGFARSYSVLGKKIKTRNGRAKKWDRNKVRYDKVILYILLTWINFGLGYRYWFARVVYKLLGWLNEIAHWRLGWFISTVQCDRYQYLSRWYFNQVFWQNKNFGCYSVGTNWYHPPQRTASVSVLLLSLM